MIEVIAKYFKNLSEKQQEQYAALGKLYPEWNEKINVISRKDIDNLYVNHILHSLAIAKFIDFQPGSNIMDLGTGGGFPGIPLAIMFPEVKFHLVDRVGKKIKVADDVAKEIGLENVTLQHGDVGEVKGTFAQQFQCSAERDNLLEGWRREPRSEQIQESGVCGRCEGLFR